MKKSASRALLALALLAAFGLSGCATTQDMDQMRADIQMAKDSAAKAQATADAAKQEAAAARAAAERAEQAALDAKAAGKWQAITESC